MYIRILIESRVLTSLNIARMGISVSLSDVVDFLQRRTWLSNPAPDALALLRETLASVKSAASQSMVELEGNSSRFEIFMAWKTEVSPLLPTIEQLMTLGRCVTVHRFDCRP